MEVVHEDSPAAPEQESITFRHQAAGEIPGRFDTLGISLVQKALSKEGLFGKDPFQLDNTGGQEFVFRGTKEQVQAVLADSDIPRYFEFTA